MNDASESSTITHPSTEVRRQQGRACRLLLFGRAETFSERIFDQEEITIGVAPGNDVQLTDPSVSRRHAIIRYAAGRFMLEDLGSKNGTRLDGAVILRAQLEPAGLIEVGSHRMLFSPGAAAVRAPNGQPWTLKTAKARLAQTFERDHLLRLLDKNLGNVTHAAREARMNRRFFRRLMVRHGIARAGAR